jgi:holdfast attachment protein HfaA
MVSILCFKSLRVCAAALSMALTAGACAQAQSNGSASFNAGYGRATTADGNAGVSAGTRDANGNRIVIDGIIQGGLDQSSISRTSMSGVADSSSGAGFGGSTAIGNNLTVITQGSWNTVIINSTQTNTGTVTAGTTTTTTGVGSSDGN